MSDKKDLIKAMQDILEAEETAKIDTRQQLIEEIVDDLIKESELLAKNDPKTHLPGTMLDKVAPAPAPAPSPKPPMPKMDMPKLKSPKPLKSPSKQPTMNMVEKSDKMGELCKWLKKCGEMSKMQKAEKLQKPVPSGVSKEKFDSCVDQVKAKSGKSANAYAVCNTSLSKDNAPHAPGSPQDSAHDIIEEGSSVRREMHKQGSSEKVLQMLEHFMRSKKPGWKRSPENQLAGLDKQEVMPVKDDAQKLSPEAKEQMEKPASDRKEDK